MYVWRRYLLKTCAMKNLSSKFFFGTGFLGVNSLRRGNFLFFFPFFFFLKAITDIEYLMDFKLIKPRG